MHTADQVAHNNFKAPSIVHATQVLKATVFSVLILTSVKQNSIIAHPWLSAQTSLVPLIVFAVAPSTVPVLPEMA